MSEEQTNASAKLNGKKWGTICAVLLILVAMIAGISIYNSPTNRLSRQLDLGNRYLEEQNYEQAKEGNLEAPIDEYGRIYWRTVPVSWGEGEESIEFDDNERLVKKTEIAYGYTNFYTYEYDTGGRIIQMDVLTLDGTEEFSHGTCTYVYNQTGFTKYEEFTISGGDTDMRAYDCEFVNEYGEYNER